MLRNLGTNKNEKEDLHSPHLEELSVDDIQLLAGSGNGVIAGDPEKDPDMPDDPNNPFGAPEYQFNEVE